MSFFGSVGNLAKQAANTAVGIAPYAAQALYRRKLEQQADEDRNARNLYAKNADQRAQATSAAQIAALGQKGEGLWTKPFPAEDENGPGMFQQHNVTGEVRRVQIQPPNAPRAQASPAPSSAIPDSALGVGGPSSQPTQGTPTTPKPTAVRPISKPKPSEPVVPTVNADGTRSYTPRSQAAGKTAPSPAPKAVSTRIDPLSTEGIKADSIKAANRAASRPGGMTGGMGSGGIGGLARTSGAITEMDQAHQNMLPYEEAVRAGKVNYDGMDYFKGQIAKLYDSHGVKDNALHTAAFANLNAKNPELANYLRNAEAWALADGALSGRTSDFRTRMDAFVSAIGPNPGQSHIDQTQRMRSTRLEEVKKFQPAMRAAANRFTAPQATGGRGGAPANVAHPPNQNDTPGNVNLGAASDLRVKYDAAVAHLQKLGKSAAEIQQTLGPPPGEE